ncbi:hypothetical protein PsYK624_067230 [Phanerochaete sordida]|uniref:Uncharacterized protein n=1 Tax=Phanerochaete sordida TaxID=48140 RepID=A0A9P3LCV0_9APHY|nr:hypothetical protein PsYK624_067230 [Phanerochaete sordida]
MSTTNNTAHPSAPRAPLPRTPWDPIRPLAGPFPAAGTFDIPVLDRPAAPKAPPPPPTRAEKAEERAQRAERRAAERARAEVEGVAATPRRRAPTRPKPQKMDVLPPAVAQSITDRGDATSYSDDIPADGLGSASMDTAIPAVQPMRLASPAPPADCLEVDLALDRLSLELLDLDTACHIKSIDDLQPTAASQGTDAGCPPPPPAWSLPDSGEAYSANGVSGPHNETLPAFQSNAPEDRQRHSSAQAHDDTREHYAAKYSDPRNNITEHPATHLAPLASALLDMDVDEECSPKAQLVDDSGALRFPLSSERCSARQPGPRATVHPPRDAWEAWRERKRADIV